MSPFLYADICFADQERSFMQKDETKRQTPTIRIYQNATGAVPYKLTNDYLFKALLQRNKTVLKALISALLHLPPEQVEDADVKNPMLPGDRITNKTVILDVNVLFNNGSRINLEMQVVNEHNWPERSTIYACRNFSDLNKGEKYKDIKPVYQIGFLDYTLFPEHPSFYATYKLTDVKSHHIFTDKLMIGVVDLKNIELATPEDKLYNINKWAQLFKAQTWEEIKMLAATSSIIDDAATTLYQLSEDERIRQECEAREDYWKREQGLLDEMNETQERFAEAQKKIADQEKTIAEQEKALTEKDEEIAKQQEEIAKLKAMLAKTN